MGTEKTNKKLDEQRREFRAFLESPKNRERFLAFATEVDPDDPQGRTRMQRVLDTLRASAADPANVNRAEDAKTLADFEAACRALN